MDDYGSVVSNGYYVFDDRRAPLDIPFKKENLVNLVKMVDEIDEIDEIDYNMTRKFFIGGISNDIPGK